MGFVLKHLVAGGVLVVGTVALTAVLYFVLLAGAAVAGEPLGGPLALPFLVLLALVTSGLAVALVLLPTTALSEWICRKYRLPWAVQIPAATAFLGLHLLLLSLLIGALRGTPGASVTLQAGVLFGLLLVPLGAYWWTVQAVGWLIRLGVTSRKRVRARAQSAAPEASTLPI